MLNIGLITRRFLLEEAVTAFRLAKITEEGAAKVILET